MGVSIEKKDFTHFSNLASVKPISTENYVNVIRELRQEFDHRFVDIRSYSFDLKLFSAPFDTDSDCASADIQLELIELQCSDELRSKFNGSSPLAFWQSQVRTRQFPALVQHAMKVATMFGSTYQCEQLFSKMNSTKSKTRGQLIDDHLNDILLLSVSSITPDFDMLCAQKCHQRSH